MVDLQQDINVLLQFIRLRLTHDVAPLMVELVHVGVGRVLLLGQFVHEDILFLLLERFLREPLLLQVEDHLLLSHLPFFGGHVSGIHVFC